ncbi:hypothetical protein [Spirosoma sp.]|uniref:hypothetical protein n=1 Tax=Spirosoma sp. TaxID=1899569 RepID=UPI0026236053|nr:hypothetical protein [Spirosoma sp.]MCX6216404.1 hypothetical protein [Spirosoma sp.]
MFQHPTHEGPAPGLGTRAKPLRMRPADGPEIGIDLRMIIPVTFFLDMGLTGGSFQQTDPLSVQGI